MRAFPVRLLIVLLAVTSLCDALRAQSKGAADANDAAYALFLSSDYAGAAAAYEKVLADYPTDLSVPTATIQLALSQFFMGDYEKAQATLTKAFSGPQLPPELAQMADHFLPQILSAKAAAMPVGTPQRKTEFEEAVKKFTDFLNKYPQSPEQENAIYERATANFQIKNYDKVVEDMQANIKRFPQSGTIAGSKDLLALAWATQGSAELMKNSGDKTKGLSLLNQAEEILRQIIAEKKDTALINEAYFQIGEILFTQAAFSPESERAAIFQKALEAYRSILPKDEIVALQKDKILAFPARKRDAVRANNMVLRKQLDKDNEREIRKLQEISVKPDQVAAAILKMGEIFFNRQSYNEARVLIGHANPFLTGDDEKMRALYYTAMTYALQNARDKAVAAYKQFVATYKEDPIAETLPFAMGNMCLGRGDPQEAVRYFEESLALYPKGRLAGLSVASKAQAESALKKFDEARKTFEKCLAENPSSDVALVATFGLAGIHKETKDLKKAILTYKSVKDKFPGTPQAAESDYWIAVCTQQTGNNAAAVPLLEAFIKAHRDHPLLPLAVYALGSAQIDLGKKDEGMATMTTLAEKFPDSLPAPYSYIRRAQLLAADGKVEAVNALLRQFLSKYPKNRSVYFAYDTLARNAVNASKPEEAIADYTEFVQKYPDDPKAAEALVKKAGLQRSLAERLAVNYSSLSSDDQAKWKKAVEQSVASAEEMIARYPSSPDLALGLQSLMASQSLLLRAQLKDAAAVEATLQGQADKCTDPGGKSKILFALAGFLFEKDRARGLAKMNEAFDRRVLYAPGDLDTYGLALIAAGKGNEAAAVFKKLAGDYPVPSGTSPNQASAVVQEAQATALFGLGSVARQQKRVADAGKLFQQLKASYPWSPKVLEADYGIADSLHADGRLDEALQLLPAIIRAPKATAELRANSLLLGGFIMKEKMKAATDAKEKTDFRGAAIDYFTKIAQFYSGVPAAAATGLWEGGQLLEDQAAASTDPKFKAQQLTRAKAIFSQLAKDFSDSEFAPKARARLAAPGGA